MNKLFLAVPYKRSFEPCLPVLHGVTYSAKMVQQALTGTGAKYHERSARSLSA